MLNWNSVSIPDFVLGTVQLGMPYGIANATGQPTETEGFDLIQLGMSRGYTWFDTAASYGTSEEFLGATFARLSEVPTVMTKLDPNLDPKNPDEVVASIRRSCATLRCSTLFGVMVHRPEWLAHWETVGVGLRRARDLGFVSHFGVSIYTPEDMTRVLEIPDLALIQLPFNAWDPRFLATASFEKAREAGRCCFLRSIYLQGLLVMKPEEVAARLPEAYDFSVRWHAICQELKLPVQVAALRYAK